MRKELLPNDVADKVDKESGVNEAGLSGSFPVKKALMLGALTVFSGLVGGCGGNSVPGPTKADLPRCDDDHPTYPCRDPWGTITGEASPEVQQLWQDIQDEHARERAVAMENFWREWFAQLGSFSPSEKFTSWADLLGPQTGTLPPQAAPTVAPAAPPAPPVLPAPAPPEKISAVKPDQVVTNRVEFAQWVADSLRSLGSRGSARAILPLEPGADFSGINFRLETFSLRVDKTVAGVSINLLDESHSLVGVNGIPPSTPLLIDAARETQVFYKPSFMNDPRLQAVVFTEDGINYYAIIGKIEPIIDLDTQLAIGVRFVGDKLDPNILEQVLASNPDFKITLSGYSNTPYQVILLAFSQGERLGLLDVGY